MNAAKLSPSFTPKTQTRSRLALQEGLLQGEVTSANKNISTPPPHVSQLTEWINLSSSGSSMQDLNEEFLDEGVPQMVRTKDSGVGSEDEDDMRSTITKREDKYLKRRLKNEKNYKDLNKSLANLALKRENRSSSSDNNTLLYNSQNQTQTDKSHNFEFQPPFCSPMHGPKNFSATTNHTNVHPYSSSGFQSKNLSGFSQFSPQKLSPRSHYSPEREKPAYLIEVKTCEPEFAKAKNVTPKENYYQNSKRTNRSTERNDLPVIQGPVKIKEYRGIQDPWLNSRITFFPGNMEKLEQLSELYTEEDRTDITPRMASEDRAVSFKDLLDIKDRKPVLDSKLPSKIDLSEKLSTRDTEDACTVHDKLSILGEDIGQARFRDDSISGSVGFLVKTRPQEEEKFEQVEKSTLDMWKKDLLQIRNEMEMRQKNYQEINKFVKMCENMDKPGRNHNSSRAKASVFSSPAQIKNDGSRSSRILTSTSSQKPRSTAMQSSALSQTFQATERTKSPMTRLERPGMNSGPRGKGNNNVNQSYFRFNNENNNGPNISSFYRDRSQDQSK